MRQTFERALAGVKLGLVRADSGFYSNQIPVPWKIDLALHHRRQGLLKPQESNLRDEELDEDLSGHRDQGAVPSAGGPRSPDTPPHRGAQANQRRPQAAGRLLFEDLPDYRFSLYVTNLDLPLEQTWNIYNSRADCENRIRELKEDFGLDAFCLQDF